MNSAHKQTLKIGFTLAVTALAFACSPDNTPAPVVEQPVSRPTTPVGNPPTTPGNDVGISLGTTQLRWSALDYQEWTQDAAGQWVRYVSQWNSAQGTSQVNKITYDFRYSTGGQVERLTVSNATQLLKYVQYRYADGQPTAATEFNATGEQLATYRFRFGQGRLVEQTETHVKPTPRQVRRLFAYNATGNLTEVQEWIKVSGKDDFELSYLRVYSQYDNKPATPMQALESYPYLPGVRFWGNNPGLKQVFGQNGQLLPGGQERYGYSFGADGKPASKTISGAGGSRTGQFQYGPRW